ncbi:MAG: 50S ribosomal protein L9 [Alphaproteobacteria bacterium]|nr:50S ribosomal protein L9 [Alphaproteobacteria bacterium]
MQVILLEKIERLGTIGDVVKVKDGFARNFLIPQNKALRATNENKAYFDAQKAVIEKDNATRRAQAEKESGKIDKLSLTLIRQASEDGRLFGSVTARDIAVELAAQGHKVSRTQVLLDSVVKNTGSYPVRVALHPEVIVTGTVHVARTEGEAEALANPEALLEEAALENLREESAPAETKDAPAEDAAE